MNLALYSRVLWRFRLLVLGGVILAMALAALSIFRLGSDGLEYRTQELWQNQGTLLLTQEGFPEGRALFPAAREPLPGEEPEVYPYAGIGRFTSLVDLYAQLANGDEVERIMRRDGPLVGSVQAYAIPPSTTSGASPLISIVGRGPTPERATTMVDRGTRALLAYLAERQKQAKIPSDERVQVRVLSRVADPVLLEGRKKTLPIIVLLAVLSATIGLAFVLENVRPAVRPLSPVADEELTEARRSA